MHGNNLNSLHQLIHPEILPSELGGMMPPYDMGTWARTLLDHAYDEESDYCPESYTLSVQDLERDLEKNLSPKTMKRSEQLWFSYYELSAILQHHISTEVRCGQYSLSDSTLQNEVDWLRLQVSQQRRSQGWFHWQARGRNLAISNLTTWCHFLRIFQTLLTYLRGLITQPGCFCAPSHCHPLIGLLPCQSRVLASGSAHVWQCASVATFNRPPHGMIHHDSKSSEASGAPADSLNHKRADAICRPMRAEMEEKKINSDRERLQSFAVYSPACPVTTKDESLLSEQFFWSSLNVLRCRKKRHLRNLEFSLEFHRPPPSIYIPISTFTASKAGKGGLVLNWCGAETPARWAAAIRTISSVVLVPLCFVGRSRWWSPGSWSGPRKWRARTTTCSHCSHWTRRQYSVHARQREETGFKW